MQPIVLFDLETLKLVNDFMYDLMMKASKLKNIINTDLGRLKPLIPIYCIKGNWGNGQNVAPVDRLCLTSILEVQYFQVSALWQQC